MVLIPGLLIIAILSGAQFIVSPTIDVDVVRLCQRYDKLVLPGALTPTEVVTAWQGGADIIKIFPASCMGPGYIKALKGPLPQVPLMPVGGIDANNIEDYLKAGACAVGVWPRVQAPACGGPCPREQQPTIQLQLPRLKRFPERSGPGAHRDSCRRASLKRTT